MKIIIMKPLSPQHLPRHGQVGCRTHLGMAESPAGWDTGVLSPALGNAGVPTVIAARGR